MSELQTEWTAEQAEENAGEANESLPEAPTTDRFRPPGTATGMDVRAGEQPYVAEPEAASQSRPRYQMPLDPPQRLTEGGDR